MSGELKDLLDRIPAEKRLSVETCEFLDKEIRRGVDLNLLQRQGLRDIVQLSMDQGLSLPPPYESFFAYLYQEWSEEAKTSEEVKRTLIKLVQKLKANGALAGTVAQTVQHMLKERALRRQEMAKVAAMLAESSGITPLDAKQNNIAREPPNAYVKKMQSARLGRGEETNLELAVQLAEEAAEAYPNSPKVLFEAAGCHQMLAEKGKFHSVTVRYVHMKEALTLFEQCMTLLTNRPYATLKGEYDTWRRGLVDLLAKVKQGLTVLQEQQR
jgi:hypothetical protein